MREISLLKQLQLKKLKFLLKYPTTPRPLVSLEQAQKHKYPTPNLSFYIPTTTLWPSAERFYKQYAQDDPKN